MVIFMSFNISNNIKNLRIENNMTEEVLSNLLSCSINDIKAWENGTSYPDIMMLPKIASIFNVSIDYLTSAMIANSGIENSAMIKTMETVRNLL